MESVCDMITIHHAYQNVSQCQRWFQNALNYCTNTLTSIQKSSCCMAKISTIWNPFHALDPEPNMYPDNIIDYPSNPFMLTSVSCKMLMHKVNQDYLIIDQQRQRIEKQLYILVVILVVVTIFFMGFACLNCIRWSRKNGKLFQIEHSNEYRYLELIAQSVKKTDEYGEIIAKLAAHLECKENISEPPNDGINLSSSLPASSRIPRPIISSIPLSSPSDSEDSSNKLSSIAVSQKSTSRSMYNGDYICPSNCSNDVKNIGKARRTRKMNPYPQVFKPVRSTKI